MKIKIKDIWLICLLPSLLVSCTMPQAVRFDRAVTDAAVVEKKDIDTRLVAVTPENSALVWNADKTRVLVVMWKSRNSFDLVMLAPANHGSALAALGKARVGRIKAWFSGVEPGQRVLDWLCLGSDGQWELNHTWLDYDFSATRFFPFVLTGQGIDHSLFDFLNSYLVEKGSDGVIRVAGANLNYRCFSLIQTRDQVIRKQPLTLRLLPDNSVKIPQPVGLGVYSGYSHSGKKMGIMRSIGPNDVNAPVVKDILKCLLVADRNGYQTRAGDLARETEVDITLHRFVDKNVFRFGPATGKPIDFKGVKPLGEPIENA